MASAANVFNLCPVEVPFRQWASTLARLKPDLAFLIIEIAVWPPHLQGNHLSTAVLDNHSC